MTHEFVETLPDDLLPGVIYVSIPYATVAHKCACGCGSEVITPLSPTDWQLTFDGDSISLFPSIGNWNFACRSHYWIKKNEIKWSYPMSEAEITSGRIQDKQKKAEYYRDAQASVQEAADESSAPRSRSRLSQFWRSLKKWFS